jgi:GT2 family glycosyltransferase
VSGRARVDFSVVICTRNRAGALTAALTAVGGLRYAGPWEIVVVDNGSTDDTSAVAERAGPQLPAPLRLVREAQRGLARARNMGVRTARGRWIAFTDDDCYPVPDWLTSARAVSERRPDAGVIGGRILLFDPTDAPFTIQERADAAIVEPGSFIEPSFIQGANMIVKRDVFERVGGFDCDFGAGTHYACEDTDLICRASFAGFSVVYDPAVTVHHHHGRKPGSSIERLKAWYAYGRGAYYAKWLLDRRTRGVFARNLYWRWRHPQYRAAWRLRLREVAGAIGFCAFVASHPGRARSGLPT